MLLASYVSRNVKPPNEDVVKSLTKLECTSTDFHSRKINTTEVRAGRYGKKKLNLDFFFFFSECLTDSRFCTIFN